MNFKETFSLIFVVYKKVYSWFA